MYRSHATQNIRSLAHHGRFSWTTKKYGSSIGVAPRKGAPLLQAISLIQTRGAKSKTKIKLSELPQGRIPAEPLPPIVEDKAEPVYPTVIHQARLNMNKFDNCVLLTRVGGFYELYFEHAEDYASLLNIKLASRKTQAGPVPMAGFPFFQIDRFLKILVQDLNRHVAIAEEFPNTAADKIKSGGLMHDRRVARIITPGTLIDENFIDQYSNNYVLSIHVPPTVQASSDLEPQPLVEERLAPVGLAWLDLSTGQFFTQASTMGSLSAILSRIGPKELVLSQELELGRKHPVFSIIAEDKRPVAFSQPGELSKITDWRPLLESEVPESTAKVLTHEEIAAGDLVLGYVKDRLQGLSMKIQPPVRHNNMEIMNIDKNSLRALEIKQTIRDGVFRGSLLHAIRRTVTKGGARLLSEWLGSPSTSLDVINARQNVVASFIEANEFRDSIILLLRKSHDAQRLVQKFALGRGDADDLLGIASTIHVAEDIAKLLKKKSKLQADAQSREGLLALEARMDLKEPRELAKRIEDSIDEEGVVRQHEVEDSEASEMIALAEDIVALEGSKTDSNVIPKAKKKRIPSLRDYNADDHDAWIMKPAASNGLKKMHAELASLQDQKEELTVSLREQLEVPSLTLRWTPGLGHIGHVKGKDFNNVKDSIRTLSSTRTTRSLYLADWTALGQSIDQARFHIRREEQAVFQSLREHVIRNLIKLRRIASVLDELDIATSFAKIAVEQNLVRPKLNNSVSHTIIGGRHPTVEGGLFEQGRTFVRNDCLIGSPTNGLLWLITGPNMAGKSTFLRQNALITIMAQVGCFVPASYAEIGIVDAIFSRVGSADNLYNDQSTFMVEMLETAQILRQATPRSFVIMDEIGRGTTPEDGTAISFACLHHLVTVNRCRTLFATHFHGVADMAAAEGFCDPKTGPVQTYCTDVEEDDQGGFVYIHKLRRGTNRHSHALKVAKMAGLPEHAINMAKRALEGVPANQRVDEALTS